LLSAYIHADPRRPPDSLVIQKLYKVIEEFARTASPGQDLPYPLAELLELGRSAAIKHCECCPEGRPSAPSDRGPAAPGTRESDHGAWLANTVADGTGVVDELPVDPGQVDRHPPQVRPSLWPALTEIEQHLAGGRDHDAQVIMRHTGAALPIDQVLDAISACRGAGLDHAADVILSHAGGRTASDVYLLSQQLNSAGQHADVGKLLSSALASLVQPPV
jgi:hypothetical protein